MKKLLAFTLALLMTAAFASAGEVKSGLEPGAYPEAFNVKDVTGPEKGTSLCYRCRYGGRPTVSIFAREVDENLVELIKQIDKQVEQNKEQQMSAFVVLLTEDPDAVEPKLEELAKKNKIKNVPLTVFDGPAGPSSYKISEKADVTVMMWVKSEVKSTHAVDGKLDKKQVEKIAADTQKILK